MLGDSLTITLGGSGGTDKVLNRINQDNYSAEYFLRESLAQYEAKVKHSKNGTRDRHHVEIKETIFAVPDGADEKVRTVSAVILAKPDDTAADVSDLQEGLNLFLSEANILKILGWQS